MPPTTLDKPRAVFFDAAGTLFDSVKHVAEVYSDLAARHDKIVSREEIARGFRKSFASAPPLAFDEKDAARLENLERLWWKELVRRVFEPTGAFDRFDEYFAELFSHFARTESWALFDDAAETLAALKRRGYTLALISNFDSRVLRIVEGLGIAGYFDTMLISSRAGYAKPAPEIFRLALEEHELAPEQAIHVGDSPETDIEGARRAGIRPVLLDRGNRAPEDDTVRIGNLKELLDLL